MKRLIMLIGVCAILLSGCTPQTSRTDSAAPTEDYKADINFETLEPLDMESYLGLWSHTEYPDNYSIIIYEAEDNSISFIIESVRGQAAQIADAHIEDAEISDGSGSFEFEDSFENTGTVTIVFEDEKLNASYEIDYPNKGTWCIAAGEGSFVKTKELDELEYFNESNYDF